MYLPYIEWRTLYFSPTDKHFGKFAHRKYKELPYPKNQKMCDLILVTLLKMRPHYSQFSRENATPSSSTSPLASYKEGLFPLPPALRCQCNTHCSPSPSNSDCLGLMSFRIICIEVLKLTINVRVIAAVRMAVSLTFCKDPWELSAK